MKRFTASLVIVLFSCANTFAQDIDFEDVAVAAGTQVTQSSDVISGGFLFDYATDHGHLANGATFSGSPWGSDNGTTYHVTDDFVGANPLTMSDVTGALFSLARVDFSEWVNSARSATNVRVTGNLFGRGTVSKSVVLDLVNDGPGPIADFQTELFDSSWTNLTSVVFKGVGTSDSYFAIDNIYLTPEPATLTFVFLGLLGLGNCRRRRA